MAWTHIKAIRFNIANSINYTMNEEKTALSNAVDYAFNRDKTQKTIFETALCCGKRTAYQEMIEVKKRFDKTQGVQGYHLVQSFKTGEVTPELCHALGVELAARLLGEGWQAAVSTHLNTDQFHNHIVWNSVNSITGKKYHIGEKDLYLSIRRISDDLCVEHGLSIIDPVPGSRGKQYAEIAAERDGRPTWRSLIRDAIDKAIERSFSFAQFLDELREQGFEIDQNPRHKFITIRAPGAQRPVRLSEKLGKGYDEDSIKQRILQNARNASQQLRREDNAEEYEDDAPQRRQKRGSQYDVFRRTSLQSAFSLKGVRGLYYRYLYELGALPKHREYEHDIPFSLRRDVAKLEKVNAMFNYMTDNGIVTLEDLHAKRDALNAQLAPLLAERKKHYRTPDSEEGIANLNEQIKPLRRELGLCGDIEKRSTEIHEKLHAVDEYNKQKEEIAYDERRRRGRSGREVHPRRD